MQVEGRNYNETSVYMERPILRQTILCLFTSIWANMIEYECLYVK